MIKKRMSGNRNYYTVNKQHPLFSDLRNMFLKTVGLKDVVYKNIQPVETEIEYVFIYGSIARSDATAASDVDLIVIGNVSSRKLSSLMLHAGNELRREINFSVFSLSEFKNRLKKNDHFITTIIKEPKIFIIGDSDEFDRMAKEWLAETASDKP
ncbi:MAG: nucleotidyltransferase domain-containing protein [Calditrichaeota bacterium]|nr:nucleotidyltransferase domain-containing protein [Calditrichota bacterium]